MAIDARDRHGINLSVGTLLANSGTVVLSNSNSVSFGLSFDGNSYIATISGLGVAVLGSISAGSTRITSGEVVFSNSNGISFGVNGQTITAGISQVSIWNNRTPQNGFRLQTNASTLNYSVQRALIERPINATRAEMLISLTSPGSTAGSYTLSLALYTMSGSTAALLSSASVIITWNSGTNSAAASIYAGQSGPRWRSIPLAWNITPGEYMIGVLGSADGPSGSIATMTLYGSQSVLSLSGGPNYFGAGLYSTGTPSIPGSIVVSDLIQSVTQTGLVDRPGQPFIQLVGTF